MPNTAIIGGLAESAANPQPQCEANLAVETAPAGGGSLTTELTVYLKNWCVAAHSCGCCAW